MVLQVSSPSAEINVSEEMLCLHVKASWEPTYLILFSFPFHFFSTSDLKVLQLKQIKRKRSAEHGPMLALWREGSGSRVPALLSLNILSFLPHTLTFHGIYISVYEA